ncbi:hypothetical protein [Streptomyces sp. NPDC010273]|uniref:hypothetical protein n=1 Tax=Streptomyces sp. NPDC010273 TaxID=3364829 RepID=UPI0036E46ABC
MGDGIQWLVGETTSSGWMLDVHFARGIGAEELALRMGASPGARAEPPDWWQRHRRHLPARAQWSPRA